MKRFLKLAAMAFAALALVVVGGWTAYHLVVGADPFVVDLFGGKDVVDLIRNADKVEAYRTEPNAAAKPRSKNPDRIGGFEILSEPVVLDEETHNDLARVLTSAWTYDWSLFLKMCEMRPGVAFRFTRGEQTQDVLNCFDCDLLAVLRNGQRPAYDDFDYGRAELVGIAKRLFPQDAVIQGLRE
jgi:hypothetical protein